MSFNSCFINSLWPGDAIWWHGTRSTLAQVMACCLMAPSHYLNQCWLVITKVLWHSFDDCFSTDALAIIEIDYLKFYSDLPGANELRKILIFNLQVSLWTRTRHYGLPWTLLRGWNSYTVWSRWFRICSWIANMFWWVTTRGVSSFIVHCMGESKRDITPVLMHWSYVSFCTDPLITYMCGSFRCGG